MEWLLLYRVMPIKTKEFLQAYLGDLNDFESTPTQVSGVFQYNSPSTSIEITYAFEMNGQLLTIWFPGVDDPTIEDHCIFVEYKEGEIA